MKEVIIYSTPICEYCKDTKDYLTKHGVGYTEKDVTKDKEALIHMKNKSKQMSVPVIEIDGEMVIGFQKEELNRLLEL